MGDVEVLFSDYDTGWAAKDFDGFDSLTKEACATQSAKYVHLKRTRHLYDEGIITIITKGGPGRINFILEGEITYQDEECEWKFEGSVSIEPNKFDFDPNRPLSKLFKPKEGERGPWGELTTHIGSWIHKTRIPKNYTIYFLGSRDVSDYGKCK